MFYAIPGAIIAYMFHEYARALVSAKLGDPLPRARHKLTLNPIVHFEPIGFLCLLATGYGWGKPVETTDLYYKERKKGTVLTYTAPMLVNFFLGIGFAAASAVIFHYADSPAALTLCKFLLAAARVNVGMAFFNLIPVPPLDGDKILRLFISPVGLRRLVAYRQIWQIILLTLMASGIVGAVFTPIVNGFIAAV